MKASVLTSVILFALCGGCHLVHSFSFTALSSRFALRSTGLPFVSNNKLNQASACSGARRKTAWFLTSSNSASDSREEDALSEISYKREDFTEEMFLKIEEDLPKLERFRKDLEEFVDTPEGNEDQTQLNRLLYIVEFRDEDLRAAYDKLVESVRESHPNFSIQRHTVTYLRENITRDLYRSISNDLTKLEILEKDTLFHLHRYPLDRTLDKVRDYVEDKLEELRESKIIFYCALDNRIAPVDYRINSSMTYRYDYDHFEARVHELFGWKDEARKDYLAPCFSFVQSSGSGKTKLLCEYKQNHNATTLLILCVPKSLTNQDAHLMETFDYTVLVPPLPIWTARDRDGLRAALDSHVQKVNSDKVVLLFDEAQLLVADDQAFLYRVVRWWLRKNKFYGKRIVAVFTGTSIMLATPFKEADPIVFSRDAPPNYNKGTKLYEPFYQLCTTGLEKHQAPTEPEGLSDLDLAAYYGRPLFAQLAAESRLDTGTLSAIRKRMLLDDAEKDSLGDTSCLSVLGTHVQMGSTSMEVATTLVERGYASLTFASSNDPDIVSITFFPDPVPAYLAMTLMVRNQDEPVSLAQEPKFWTTKASHLFSSGLCHPQNKRDIGAIAAALYFLFCGDVLRLAIDRSLKTFAVPLSHFLRLAADPKDATSLDTDSSLFNLASTPSVSFIQVCRNYMKLSLNDLVAKGYLQEWFKAGLAFYHYPGGRVYDIIAPIRIRKGKHSKYYPMLIRVKNGEKYTASRQRKDLETMDEYLKSETVEQTGVCIVLATGLSAIPGNVDKSATVLDKLETWKGEGILCLSIAVPPNDCFGCWNLATELAVAGGNVVAQSAVTAGGAKAKKFASHFMVHHSSGSVLEAEQSMRDRGRKPKASRKPKAKVSEDPNNS